MSKQLDAEDQPWIGTDTAPGFTITCNTCGSIEVYLENDMGRSDESGGWGGIDLICNACGARISIFENY